MITCNECLDALSTSRLADIRSGSPVATHYSTCDACRRVVQDLQYAENGLASVLDQFGPRMTPQAVARNAADSMFRRRRRIARVARAGLALIALGVLAIGFEAFLEDDEPSWTEMVQLNCLSSDQALAISQRFAGTNAYISTTDQERTIRLQGSQGDVIEAAARISVADRTGECEIVPPPGDERSATQPADKGGTD